jgi:ATP-dependent DNA helicase RecG
MVGFPGMNRDQIPALMKELESDRVERTISTSDTDKFSKAICAFSNDMPHHRQPGYLFVGVRDDGKVSGADISDQLLQNLAAIRSDGNIQPLPVMNVERLETPEGAVAVVEVFPSDLPPVRYKGQVWIRVGPRRAIASESEERILAERRVSSARTWDARPCLDATLDDLALDLFLVGYRSYAVAAETIEENHRTISEQLAALRFYDSVRNRPTNAAILLFGKDSLAFVPGAYVQYVRYDGSTQADSPSRDRRFIGDLLSILRGLDQLAEDIASARPAPGQGLAERMVFAYPPRALHELFVNAIVHRNYEGSTAPVLINHFDDRIEISNPGSLYGDLTAEQFPRGTSYRNPVLAEAAKTLGFVNRYGRGIVIAQAELRKNDSPEAHFDLGANYFLVTIRRRE